MQQLRVGDSTLTSPLPLAKPAEPVADTPASREGHTMVPFRSKVGLPANRLICPRNPRRLHEDTLATSRSSLACRSHYLSLRPPHRPGLTQSHRRHFEATRRRI